MQMNLHFSQGNQFTNYSDTSVTINASQHYDNNLIVTPNEIISANWQHIDEISIDDAAILSILQAKPDLIIFGTGNKIRMPNIEVIKMLQKQQIGFEVMPIPALCRTFNYLIGEGRKVVGIIIY